MGKSEDSLENRVEVWGKNSFREGFAPHFSIASDI
jgi:hypothetical protein